MAVSEKSIQDKIVMSSILEEIKKERENDDLAFSTKYSHKEDLEKLLNLAEELDEKCNKTKSRINIYKFFQVTGGILILFWAFYTNPFTATDSSINTLIIVSVVSILSCVITVGVCQVLFLNTLIKQLSSDKRALSEVLQLLRETSNSIAEQEEWSVLSRAEFRIRLSRFDLGKYKSKFNFFS